MKHLLKFLLVGVFALLLPLACLAQDSAAPAPLSADAQNFILSLLLAAAAKYPVVTSLVAVIGTMRLWAKPVSSIVHQVVELTPTKYDDTLLAKWFDFFTVNPVGKVIAYLFDWLGSIKLVAPATPTKPNP